MRFVIIVALVAIPLAGVRGQTLADDDGVLRLRPGDAVRLQLAGEPAFRCGLASGPEDGELPSGWGRVACDFDVDEEGKVLLPLVGTVAVAGVPFSEVRERIRSAFARELREPMVSVTPLLRIAVLGEVQVPGLLRVDPTYTLSDVLAEAGGFTEEAAQDDVVLLRDGSRMRLSVEQVALGAPVPLRPGDQVVVGRRGWLARNANIALSVAGSVLAAVFTSLILR